MEKDDLRLEIDEITKLFLSVKYIECDFRCLFTVKKDYPIVYSTYPFLIERIGFAVMSTLTLGLCKLFERSEKYSLIRLRNKIGEGYNKSALNKLLSKEDLDILFDPLESKEVVEIMGKLKTARDEYYAHLDRTRTVFEHIRVNGDQTSKLISIAEYILKMIELKYFKEDVSYYLSKPELGHTIFDKLNEWEYYRENFGYVKKPINL